MRPLDVLWTATEQRVLTALLLRQDRAFQLVELIAAANSGSASVQRFIARLVDGALVVRVPHGKRYLYRANSESPIFADLRSIFVKTVGLVDPIRDALAPISKAIEFALIFGSIAKGTDHAASDVDVLVVGSVLLEDVFEALHKVERTLARKVSPTVYTRAEYEHRLHEGNAFLKNVLSGEHINLIGTA
ncbi:MAG: nucleotidyltransferase domain-containing protein [Kofleriaceae bacterium]